ncbi:type I restriction-modification system subunit M N-terminal domain-containing protein [Zobellia uliginosa]|uniref:type I restriction-modification system subunit M N-terminal domain-containing protein n=1 Tax=Zobellia uliginosa TaxID=143224 RepID=UPI0026E3C156|nr:type I restriction-modification system subunit M N-terminal domain-containing protein [Zobellia uliginosa]
MGHKIILTFVLTDLDEYRSRNTFMIPKTASWQYLKDKAEQDDIKVKVDEAFDVFQEESAGKRP